MLTIGFTTVYYTLWSVTKTTRRGLGGAEFEDTVYRYHQNLSMDFGEAQKKAAIMSDGLYEVDLDLRGEEGRFFTRTRQIKSMDIEVFTFGQMAGTRMDHCTHIWQLERAMREEPNPRRRVMARRRLIQLGELVRRDYIERVVRPVGSDEWDSENMDNNIIQVRRKWMPKRLATYMAEIGDKKGLFFTDKARMNILVKKIKQTSKDGFDFRGRETVIYRLTMITSEGYIVEYKGENPPSISDNEFVQIKATIKHNSYGDLKQTFLLRIKVVTETAVA